MSEQLRSVVERDFTSFWERKYRKLVSTMPSLPAVRPGETLAEVKADRRRLRRWMDDHYQGPLPPLGREVQEMVSYVHSAADCSRAAGHRVERRMWAMVPVMIHRSWCEGLVAPLDPTGWPMINGISVRVDLWTYPFDPAQVDSGLDHTGDDIFVIWTRHLYRPIEMRYVLAGDHTDETRIIYSRLRSDGWLPARALEGARLLAARQ